MNYHQQRKNSSNPGFFSFCCFCHPSNVVGAKVEWMVSAGSASVLQRASGGAQWVSVAKEEDCQKGPSVTLLPSKFRMNECFRGRKQPRMWEKVGKSQRPSIIGDMTDPKLVVSDEKDQMIYVLGNNLSSFFFGLSLKAFMLGWSTDSLGILWSKA